MDRKKRKEESDKIYDILKKDFSEKEIYEISTTLFNMLQKKQKLFK